MPESRPVVVKFVPAPADSGREPAMLLMAGLLCTFQATARHTESGADYCVTVQSAGYRPLSVAVSETNSGRFATEHPTRGGGPTYARMAHLVRAVLKAAGYPGPAFAFAGPRPVTLFNSRQQGPAFTCGASSNFRLSAAAQGESPSDIVPF